jgi:diacylglycerol kinase family enzyme
MRTHSVLVINPRSGQGRAAAGWLPTAWEEQVAARFRIEVPSGRVRAAIDGEPVVLDSPLELESVPQALRVLVPARMAE